jgi:hypothetical protein
LACVLDEVTNEMVSSKDEARSDECREAIGALCLEGYAGTGMAACSRCCKLDDSDATGNCPPDPKYGKTNWYLQSADNQCNRCPNSSPTTLIIVGIIIAALLGPILLRAADAMKHAGHLQGPVMRYVIIRLRYYSTTVFLRLCD